ncbi:MAG: CehA/McbA family metallohydrolase [Proteobacteria bacterium]|nr:CehA/McbA family metallohydrolase [Pseudomonadota bacterium]
MSRLLGGLALAIASGIGGCSEEPRSDRKGRDAPPLPVETRSGGAPGSSFEYAQGLVESLTRARHPSDGGGHAWLESSEAEPAVAISGVARGYRLVYEVGSEGIARGGSVVFQVSPFWGWREPQLKNPDAPGYTVVTLEADSSFRAEPRPPRSLHVIVTGRALRGGDRVRIHYGAGEQGAVARFAESRAGFEIGVDGNGDGTTALLAEPVQLQVVAGRAATLAVTLPATAKPGARVIVRIAALDAQGNAAEDFAGDVVLHSIGEASLETQRRVFLRPGDRGRAQVSGVVGAEGVVRLRVEGPGDLRGWSNPLDVAEAAPRILWGDVHGHSAYSDGAGTPEEYFRFSRDVAGLDVVALTDHDYWGPRRLDRDAAKWVEIQEQVRRFHEPGRFVALLGYEWTSWIHGHRHVLYFEDRGEIFSAIDPRYDTPPRLWSALAGLPALTFAHHSAGGPIATNWEFSPDPVLEPLTEVSSVHGSSEAADSPRVVSDAIAGNFVRDVLDRGYRLGFIGSGDTHSGHPGALPAGRPPAGLAAILSETSTREGVLEAMRARRVYATNGPRIVLRATLGGRPMGSTLSPSSSEELRVRVVAARNLERIDLIRSGAIALTEVPPRKSVEWSLRRSIRDLQPGEYLYVRVVQKDGGAAWSSPFFVTN